MDGPWTKGWPAISIKAASMIYTPAVFSSSGPAFGSGVIGESRSETFLQGVNVPVDTSLDTDDERTCPTLLAR
jgi:hypothetical protein